MPVVEGPPSGGLTPYAIYLDLGEAVAQQKTQPADTASSAQQLWTIAASLGAINETLREIFETIQSDGLGSISDEDLDDWIEEASQREHGTNKMGRVKFPRHGSLERRRNVASINAAAKAIEDYGDENDAINDDLCLLLRGFRAQRDVSKLDLSELEPMTASELIASLDD